MDEFKAAAFEPVVLTTERLVLRRLVAADATALFAIFSDPEVMRYWSSTAWESLQQADNYVANADAGIASGCDLRLGIALAGAGQQAGQLVGQIALYRFDQQNRRCDVGYALGRAHWGRGYLGEAMKAMLDHGFGALGLNRVEADVDPRNAASARLLERMGFMREGLLRERWIVGGEVCDTAFYGLLRRDWIGGEQRRQPPACGPCSR
jgi:ribosomal-protein-alanine N-acetyltransferase